MVSVRRAVISGVVFVRTASEAINSLEGRGLERRRLLGGLIAQRVSALGGCEETSVKGGNLAYTVYFGATINRR